MSGSGQASSGIPLSGSGEAGSGGPGAGADYLIRAAEAEDLDAIAAYEIEIAVVSFADEAITDPALHRKRVAGALGKAGEITLVAVAADAPRTPLGWAWLSARTNSLTGERYGNFRSLAVADVPDRSLIGELLLAAVIDAADRGGLGRLTGKVHAANLGMRALYRKFGFEAAHLTMERRTTGQPAADGAGPHRAGQEGSGQEGSGPAGQARPS